jgi:hypothetical protein
MFAVVRLQVDGRSRKKKADAPFKASAGGRADEMAYLGVETGGSFTLCVD